MLVSLRVASSDEFTAASVRRSAALDVVATALGTVPAQLMENLFTYINNKLHAEWDYERTPVRCTSVSSK